MLENRQETASQRHSQQWFKNKVWTAAQKVKEIIYKIKFFCKP